ncbi:uncharacterized protein LOC113228806 [Hyposmocoma kahamanoa]|uniref:uncharacterized protein LOC113228806 n=1 Tax=Hyposmocoma kahamanoa TaxID=1477025 RepID=UPI000E6D7757|nr:uncharacterized protein LOC113228806 [Hyposmocoma kahamanoa]
MQRLEWLKKAGLSDEEIVLYQNNEGTVLDSPVQHSKVESGVLRSKLEKINKKINHFQYRAGGSNQQEESIEANIFEKLQKKPIKFYPEGHPMNELKQLEDNLFGHLKSDIIPITKRRKILRRLERKTERILAQQKQLMASDSKTDNEPPIVNRPGSLWDVREIPKRQEQTLKCKIIGPKKKTMYTIKDNKILRLEHINGEKSNEYKAVDIVIPVNEAEQQLLEGTKMCIDDIKKIERFKDYMPGVPSKVLYLKNIASAVTQDQLTMLFNQFVLDNGGPIDVQLMTGRMRGQAFVTFQNVEVAITALDEVNGTIINGQPIIVQFGRNAEHER